MSEVGRCRDDHHDHRAERDRQRPTARTRVGVLAAHREPQRAEPDKHDTRQERRQPGRCRQIQLALSLSFGLPDERSRLARIKLTFLGRLGASFVECAVHVPLLHPG